VELRELIRKVLDPSTKDHIITIDKIAAILKKLNGRETGKTPISKTIKKAAKEKKIGIFILPA
jgi:hypothetical protein